MNVLRGVLGGIGGAMAGVFGGPQMGAAVQGVLGQLLSAPPGSIIPVRSPAHGQIMAQALARFDQAAYADGQAGLLAIRAEAREMLITSFMEDRIGTWLQRSPGDETFGEWAHREEL